jgi:hypothetical protein
MFTPIKKSLKRSVPKQYFKLDSKSTYRENPMFANFKPLRVNPNADTPCSTSYSQALVLYKSQNVDNYNYWCEQLFFRG